VRALLLDVGNTRIKWGVGDETGIHRTGHITQATLKEKGLGVLTSRLPHDVDAVIASNVAGPTFATRLAGVIGAHCGRDVRFAASTRTACGITNGYRQPRRLGVDRWVALIGAWAELERACLVVDAGTAVTIDALDDDGQHLGGQILPGIALMASSLADDTAQIPPTKPVKTELLTGENLFAKNTRTAVQSGALGAVTGAVEIAIRTLRSSAYDAELVLTGGDASRILGALDAEPLHRPNLVLQGLWRLLETDPPRTP